MIHILEKGCLDTCGKQGKWEYYLNDILIREIEYMNNKEEGRFLLYHTNGVLAIKTQCTKGMLDGVWEEYYETGKLKEISVYRQGKYEPISFYTEDGKCLLMAGTGKRFETLGKQQPVTYEQYYKNGVFLSERCIDRNYNR